MVMHSWPKLTDVLKWGQNAQIFTSLIATMKTFSDMEHVMKMKEIQRNGVIRCMGLAPNDLLMSKM